MTTGLNRALLFLYAETPVHPGADAGQGALDLPIQREVSTGLPIIKAESLKGALREHLRPPVLDESTWKRMFGSPPPTSGIAAGALSPGEIRVHEAQLVAFPAPSLEGFFWVTGPLARARLARRAALAGLTYEAGVASRDSGAPESSEADDGDDTRCLMTDTRTKGSKKPRTMPVVLGSYAFTGVGDAGLKSWAARLAEAALPALAEHAFFRGKLAKDLYQVSDTALAAITKECTAIVARVQLGAPGEDGNPTKSVRHGPFYSEYLPTETLLAALLESASPDHLTVLAGKLDDHVIQVGGDETTGKGLMWCRVARPPATGRPDGESLANGTQP
ncbi:MAG: type III-B CRISPR module RAMP protein Cmr4 [Streptosporangiaceae bacterium]